MIKASPLLKDEKLLLFRLANSRQTDRLEIILKN